MREEGEGKSHLELQHGLVDQLQHLFAARPRTVKPHPTTASVFPCERRAAAAVVYIAVREKGRHTDR